MAAPTAHPPRSVAVVGLGLVGGSLCLALRRRLPATRIVGITRSPRTAAAAVRSGACDDAGAGAGPLRGCDVAVLCTPVDAMPEWMERCADAAPDLLVTDVGSTKAWLVEAAAPRLGDRFLGGHPMAGRERSGWDAADPDLFAGATWVLTPTAPGHLERHASWLAVVEALGARVEVLDAAVHDRAAALVSHLPFSISAALMRAVAGHPAWEQGAGLAATGMRDCVRLAGGDPAMEAAIVRTNTAPLLEALDALLAELAGLRRAAGDTGALTAWFAEARRLRQAWYDGRERDGRPVP